MPKAGPMPGTGSPSAEDISPTAHVQLRAGWPWGWDQPTVTPGLPPAYFVPARCRPGAPRASLHLTSSSVLFPRPCPPPALPFQWNFSPVSGFRGGFRPCPACSLGMAGQCVSLLQQFMEIEPEMLAMETIVPVYFAVEDEALLSIYEQTRAASASRGSASAAEGGLGLQEPGGHLGACMLWAGVALCRSGTLNTSLVITGAGHRPCPDVL